MERINIEAVHRDGSKVVAVRSVLAVFGGQHLVSTDTVRVPLAVDAVPALAEQESWLLRQAVEQEIRGWAAMLPLHYV